MPIHVIVTESDIANGEPSSGDSCPIALAVRRLTKLAVLVDTTGIQTWDHERYTETFHKWAIPFEAIDFINHFDSGCHVEPFEFDAS